MLLGKMRVNTLFFSSPSKKLNKKRNIFKVPQNSVKTESRIGYTDSLYFILTRATPGSRSKFFWHHGELPPGTHPQRAPAAGWSSLLSAGHRARHPCGSAPNGKEEGRRRGPVAPLPPPRHRPAGRPRPLQQRWRGARRGFPRDHQRAPAAGSAPACPLPAARGRTT